MNKKIVMSGASIMMAFTLLTGATFAAFSATNTNTGNTFSAGNMTLQVNTQAGTSTGVFSVPSAAPGQSFDQKLTLKNGGTVAASSVKVSGIALGGGSTANFADHLTIQFFTDTNDNGILDSGETVLGSGHLSDPVWNAGFTLPGVTLAAGGTYNLGARLTLDQDTSDTFQGANATFNISLQANQ